MYGFDTVDYGRDNDLDADDGTEPIFFNSHEMTTFPRYESQAVTFHKNHDLERLSPYRGYFEDLRSVSAKCNQEPAPTLINAYLKQSWVEHDQRGTLFDIAC